MHLISWELWLGQVPKWPVARMPGGLVVLVPPREVVRRAGVMEIGTGAAVRCVYSDVTGKGMRAEKMRLRRAWSASACLTQINPGTLLGKDCCLQALPSSCAAYGGHSAPFCVWQHLTPLFPLPPVIDSVECTCACTCFPLPPAGLDAGALVLTLALMLGLLSWGMMAEGQQQWRTSLGLLLLQAVPMLLSGVLLAKPQVRICIQPRVEQQNAAACLDRPHVLQAGTQKLAAQPPACSLRASHGNLGQCVVVRWPCLRWQQLQRWWSVRRAPFTGAQRCGCVYACPLPY